MFYQILFSKQCRFLPPRLLLRTEQAFKRKIIGPVKAQLIPRWMPKARLPTEWPSSYGMSREIWRHGRSNRSGTLRLWGLESENQQWNTSLSQPTAGIRQKCVNSKQNNNYNNQNTNRKGNRNNNIHRKQARVLMTLRFTHNYAQRGETKRIPVIRRQRL